MARTVLDILDELEMTSGSNAKKDILQVARTNHLLRNVFIAALDPYTVYYVSKFKVPRAVTEGPDDDTATVAYLGLLQKLAARELTGNAAKDAVASFFKDLDVRQQKWFKRILIHNLRCGVQASTVNKVWPDTINPFLVSLAGTLKSQFTKGVGIEILETVKYPVRVEPKLDGLRCVAIKQDGLVTFYTRNGTILETLPTIKAALEAANYDNVVLDGESMGAHWNESASVMMSSKSKKDDSNMFYNIFDAMPLEDWIARSTRLTYAKRCGMVSGIVQKVNDACVRQISHIMARNEAELKAFFAKCMDEGYEGVMLKTLDSYYEWDRGRNILKLKPVVTYEGVIVGHYEGRSGTKHEGKFGGFRVLLPNGIVTKVGGGFNDAMRALVQLETPDAWIGRIAECEAQPDPLTADGLTAEGKMRFPVYVRIRDESDVDPKVMLAYDTWKESHRHE
jgi:DNA ligase-1